MTWDRRVVPLNKFINACPICGCEDCPDKVLCTRQPQPFVDFVPCPSCGCMGKSRFSSSSYQQSIAENAERVEIEMITMKPSQNSGSGPAAGKKTSAMNWLKTEKLFKDPQTVKVLAVKQQANSRSGEDELILKFALQGESTFWTLRSSNPNLEILLTAFGSDENEWVGKEFGLYAGVDNFSDKIWPAVTLEMPKREVKSSRKG